MPTADQLVQLSVEVSNCRLCDQSGIEVRHAGPMNRGTGRDALIVGIQPGNTELETAEAFSGLGGRRLMEWLEGAGLGNSREEILQRVHMTSICKCNVTGESTLRQAAQNCHRFLQRQIAIFQPRVFVTLGKEPVQFLFGVTLELERLVSRNWQEREWYDGMFPLLSPDCIIIPLPHPSPLSRWLNSQAHKELLADAIIRLKGAVR
jgi:uracil-DNA glycosylase